MSKHTPGPWEINRHATEQGPDWIIDSGLVNVAVVHPKGDPCEAEANARLIAAGPELLEACREAREFANAIIQGRLFNAEQVRNTLRQAIAKAEGQE